MQESGTLHELKPLAVIRLMNGDDIAADVDSITFQEHGIRVWKDVTHKHSTFFPFANIQWVQS